MLGFPLKGIHGPGVVYRSGLPTCACGLPASRAWVIAALWAFFILNRALHPLVIDLSKVPVSSAADVASADSEHPVGQRVCL